LLGIVMLSPHMLESPYVVREIQAFLERKSKEPHFRLLFFWYKDLTNQGRLEARLNVRLNMDNLEDHYANIVAGSVPEFAREVLTNTARDIAKGLVHTLKSIVDPQLHRLCEPQVVKAKEKLVEIQHALGLLDIKCTLAEFMENSNDVCFRCVLTDAL
jgi:hypothetical protein